MLLIFASLFFYAYWHPPYFFLLLVSILVNFQLGWMIRAGERAFLVVGLVFNLGLIAYFKYSIFILQDVLHAGLAFNILLPIGISFFTF